MPRNGGDDRGRRQPLIPNQHVMAANRRGTRHPNLSTAIFDKRAVFAPERQTGSRLSLISSGAEAVVARSNQELIELAMTEISDALPLVRSATLLRAVVVREKKASFSVAPGQPARPATKTGVPGLFLAGDWIDTGLPATIEGAVISGHWAAAAIESGN